MSGVNCSNIRKHSVESRAFTVCSPLSRVKSIFLTELYRRLSSESGLQFNLRMFRRSIEIKKVKSKNFWYRLGLSLSDGSPLGTHSIIGLDTMRYGCCSVGIQYIAYILRETHAVENNDKGDSCRQSLCH